MFFEMSFHFQNVILFWKVLSFSKCERFREFFFPFSTKFCKERFVNNICCAKNYTVRSTEITMGPFKIIAFEFNWLHLNSIGCIASTFDEGSKISQNIIIIVKVERILNFWCNRWCMSRWSLFSSLKIFHNIDYDQNLLTILVLLKKSFCSVIYGLYPTKPFGEIFVLT